jgi:hypothetical protein
MDARVKRILEALDAVVPNRACPMSREDRKTAPPLAPDHPGQRQQSAEAQTHTQREATELCSIEICVGS